MRHARLVIHRLCLDDVAVRVRFGTLVAVARDQQRSADIGDTSIDPTDGTGVDVDGDWEIVAQLVEEFGGGLGRVGVEALCITGTEPSGAPVLSTLSGIAAVVRFVDRSIVLRGDGPLDGLDQRLLRS